MLDGAIKAWTIWEKTNNLEAETLRWQKYYLLLELTWYPELIDNEEVTHWWIQIVNAINALDYPIKDFIQAVNAENKLMDPRVLPTPTDAAEILKAQKKQEAAYLNYELKNITNTWAFQAKSSTFNPVHQ